MPELYEGQIEVVAAKLAQCEALQATDEAKLQTVTDATERATIMRRMAGRTGLITGYQRTLAKCQGEPMEEREDSLRIRLSATEKQRLQQQADTAGMSVSAYIRHLVNEIDERNKAFPK